MRSAYIGMNIASLRSSEKFKAISVVLKKITPYKTTSNNFVHSRDYHKYSWSFSLNILFRNVNKITSPTMHHSFRPYLPDLKFQKHWNSSLFLQFLWFQIEQTWPKSMRLLGEVNSSTFLTDPLTKKNAWLSSQINFYCIKFHLTKKRSCGHV